MADGDPTILGTIARLRFLIVAWFVRLAWPVSLVWGVVNLFQKKMEDGVIRTGLGVVLFVIWLFLVRTRGRFTLNRGGHLEK